jgi:MinD superfamily P-loop ATPase/predicted Fe-Mo cluster-binding NifX family protein
VQSATLDAPTRVVTGIAPPELVILSGKGGTGKTAVAAAFAALAENRTLADTDVDAPNLHLLLAPRIMSDEAFSGGGRAVLDPLRCDGCGLCARECRFEAITMEASDADPTMRIPIVNASACEGCGLCVIVCPTDAFRLEPVETGRIFGSMTDCGPMAHARLHAGAANSGKLATAVRRLAGSLAAAAASTEVLIDGPPGIGCPAIASLTGAARALLVTEPTVSGRHDLERLLALTRQFGVKPLLVINKEDLNSAQADAIRRFGAAHGVEYLGGIPFDETVYAALAEGKTVVENGNGPAAEAIRGIWRRLAGETTQGETRDMKIAIPVAGGRLCPHFGHCDEFCLIEADQEKKALGTKTMVTPPPHEPGLLPRWLHEQGVDLVIAGGMGQRAQNLFRQNGIEVVVGAPTEVPEQLAQAWLDGKLSSGENVCDH